MARKPIRSRYLSCLLLVLAAGFGLALLVVGFRKPGHDAEAVAWLLFFPIFLAPVLALLARDINRRDAEDIVNDPDARLILYLRPFDQDNLPSPGNRPWKSFLERSWPRVEVAFYVFMFAGLGLVALSVLGWPWNRIAMVFGVVFVIGIYAALLYSLVALVRYLRGRANVSLEQELCHHLRHCGELVAVGEPGEWLAPAGGARVYSDDDQWQAIALKAMREAQVIVIHLVPEGWTWWEFGQCLALGRAERVLAVLSKSWFTDESYARLRQRLLAEHGIELSETCPEFAFLLLGDGRLCELQMKYIHPLFWPFAVHKLSGATFEAFLAPLGLGRDRRGRSSETQG